ncbi:hypothetical protein OHA21_43675 [Actinoplanes sp. NBC_00393]|uniref:hypothetical protein n=1 Tax=Actinoplanes sp. NBC_00393 TaxID=2975953 RepID=UPI002E1AFD5A
MKTFPGWRAVGRAMRWARRERAIFTLITEGARFEETSWRRGGAFAVLTATGGDQLDLIVNLAHGGQVDMSDLDAAESLRVLAALDLIPADLAQVRDERYARCTVCGRTVTWAPGHGMWQARWVHVDQHAWMAGTGHVAEVANA